MVNNMSVHYADHVSLSSLDIKKWNLIQWSAVITCPIYHDITHGTAITVAQRESDYIIASGTRLCALTASYGVSTVRNLEKIDRVITAPHCITWKVQGGTRLVDIPTEHGANFTVFYVWNACYMQYVIRLMTKRNQVTEPLLPVESKYLK